MRRLTPVRIALLALFVGLLAARLGLHPNTPYKSFLLSLAPMVAAWLALGSWIGAARRIILGLTALGSMALVAAWCFGARPDGLAQLPVAWTIPALIGVWLVLLLLVALLVALLSGGLNSYFRPAPMTALGTAAVIYALASGFLPLPLGAPLMTAGMVWLALWQGIYLYQVKLP